MFNILHHPRIELSYCTKSFLSLTHSITLWLVKTECIPVKCAMLAFDNCRCYPYDECRNSLEEKKNNRSHKTIKCLLIQDFPCECLHPTVLCDEHSGWHNGTQAVISCSLDCSASLLLFCLLFTRTDTSPHCSAGPQTTGYVRLQCDHSVWLRPHPPYQKGYRTMLPSLVSLFFFLTVFFLLSLTHAQTHTLTLDLSVLMRRAWDSCLRQCRCA